jgi:hypothetical protein
MKLTDILREIDDQDGSSDYREAREIVLRTKTTPLTDVEDALNDIRNYGKYASNKQNTNTDVKKIKDAYFGPSGMGPNAKAKVTRTIWNEADTSWRKFKLEDIKSRHPEIDITGLEDMRFEELPKEVSDPRVYFISPYTKDKLDALIASMTGNADILYWYEDNGALIFPKDKNENMAGGNAVMNIIKTVMDNAGITDAKARLENDAGEVSTITKTTQMQVPVESKGDASNLRKELQAKFIIPSAGYKIKEDENGFLLSITSITLTQKANITNYLREKKKEEERKKNKNKDKDKLDEIAFERKKMLRLAGIIK